MKKIFLILFVFILSSNIVWSVKGDNQIGVSFSNFSGWGLDYQYKFNPEMTVRFVGFPYYVGESPPDQVNKFFNYGLQFQYKLFRIDNHRIFALMGYNHWDNAISDTSRFIDQGFEYVRKHRTEMTIDNYYFGLGYEYTLLKYVSISLEIAYLFQYISNDYDKYDNNLRINLNKLISRSAVGKFNGLGFGFAFRYNF